MPLDTTGIFNEAYCIYNVDYCFELLLTVSSVHIYSSPDTFKILQSGDRDILIFLADCPRIPCDHFAAPPVPNIHPEAQTQIFDAHRRLSTKPHTVPPFLHPPSPKPFDPKVYPHIPWVMVDQWHPWCWLQSGYCSIDSPRNTALESDLGRLFCANHPADLFAKYLRPSEPHRVIISFAHARIGCWNH
jgi:hypothetical protein